MENRFEVQVRSFDQGLILDMAGDLTKEAEELLLGLRDWEKGLDGKRYLVFNFTKVPYINSTGIAILIRIARAGPKGSFHSFAYGISPHFQKLFRMIGLTEYLMIYPDEYSILQRIQDLADNVHNLDTNF